MTSDLQSDNAADPPAWAEPGRGHDAAARTRVVEARAADGAGDVPGEDPFGAPHEHDGDDREDEDGREPSGDEHAADASMPGPHDALTPRRFRRGWERGRVWFRPNEAPRPDPRPSLRDRLVPQYYREFFPGSGWILPLLITVVGGVLRFWNLAWPNKIIFDETYYAKDGWSMYVFGWEHTWNGADNGNVANNKLIGSGALGHNGITDFSCNSTCPEFVAHPPVGKWLIGAGEKVWGLNPVGWRIMEALLGTLAIYVIARLARRMFRSTLMGCIAGILFAFDGLSFVMARTALLDGIQMFFVLGAFAALLVDRDKTRARFADWRDERGTA
ncbi:MAG: phospholipid carrier-dependent glycosyltransferase, partial [Actinocrinis sp.]